MPKVSIIVPIYNVEAYLPECIESLRKQTLEDIEIILVDDESPDNCPEMCDKYAQEDNRIKVIHKKNGGLGFARNSGLEVATGEYVAFIDSDDIIDPCTYKYLLDRHQSFQPDVIFYKLQRFADSQLPTTQKDLSYQYIEEDDIDTLKLNIISADHREHKERIIECSSCTAIYKRELLEFNQIRFHSERKLVSEDIVFNLDFLSVATKCCIDKSVLYFYRYNPYSLTHTISIEKFDRFTTFDLYLRKSLHLWKLTENAEYRISRLTIGSFRGALCQILVSSSSIRSKYNVFMQCVNNQALIKSLAMYPYMDYPLFQRTFAIGMKHKLFWLIMTLAYIKKYIKKSS